MRKLALLALIMVVLMGCNVASQVQDWAEKAASQPWRAQYRVVFHQGDGDLEMTVVEEQGVSLKLDIEMPSGSMSLEYADGLLVNLDEGNLEWEDFYRQPPYYALSQVCRQLMAAELVSEGEWASAAGYSIRLQAGLPVEIKWEDQWTLHLQSLLWQ